MRFNILWAKNNLSFDGIYNVLGSEGARMMCPSGAACIYAVFGFSELAL
jgi:hypothetical protein